MKRDNMYSFIFTWVVTEEDEKIVNKSIEEANRILRKEVGSILRCSEKEVGVRLLLVESGEYYWLEEESGEKEKKSSKEKGNENAIILPGSRLVIVANSVDEINAVEEALIKLSTKSKNARDKPYESR